MAATLLPWQDAVYQDTFSIYRQDERDRNAAGSSLGLRLVFSGERCKCHDTDNYDSHMSPAGQSKVENIMTSDKIDCANSLAIKAEDVAYVQSHDGRTFWGQVAGDPKNRDVLSMTSYQRFYVSPQTPPKIVPGTWNS